jgi:hypothetical protein
MKKQTLSASLREVASRFGGKRSAQESEGVIEVAAADHARRLRKSLILGNVIVWLVLLLAAKWFFF